MCIFCLLLRTGPGGVGWLGKFDVLRGEVARPGAHSWLLLELGFEFQAPWLQSLTLNLHGVPPPSLTHPGRPRGLNAALSPNNFRSTNTTNLTNTHVKVELFRFLLHLLSFVILPTHFGFLTLVTVSGFYL